MFVPTVYFLKNAVLIICTCGISGWYLHYGDPNLPSNPALTGLQWAFTTSSGASYLAALVMYGIHELNSLAQSKLKYIEPLHMFAAVIMCCIKQIVEGLSRFMLISHTFQGGSIWQAGKTGFSLLKKHLGNFVVTDSVAQNVLGFGTCLLSTCFGFAAWAWFEDVLGTGILSWARNDDNGDIVIMLIIWVMVYIVSRPILFLVLLCLIGDFLTWTVISAMLAGMFVGCIACILFRFFAWNVIFASDAMIYCFAVEAEAGQQQEQRFRELYEVVHTQIKDPKLEGTPTDNQQGQQNTQGKEPLQKMATE
eukprot:gnl/MRDRNA2_/MRDRNA2_193283_c0_seq1.p1 gnl/MRDRNA2_/MRDRNA2_193283_c0~~gnl/MRDRNA2_/MRDRNA2_193283_c0_seq1.p1  ORF type:complete len:346 (+),score=48.62 gnl/MRDRNA2_/MRDRNA2_193283_c0_seq1:115-1038(+)